MIYSFTLASTPVYVYNSPVDHVPSEILVYSFATKQKHCLGISCANCPTYTGGDCIDKLRQTILNQPDFISKFPELLL